MSQVVKIIAAMILGVSIGTWLAMTYCALTRLRMAGRAAMRLAVEVMIQFPYLCLQIFQQKLKTSIKIKTLEASDLTYIAVFPLDKAQHSPIYLGRSVWEARAEDEIKELISRIKPQTSELPSDCYGIVHVKGGQRVSWIYRQGKFTVSQSSRLRQQAETFGAGES